MNTQTIHNNGDGTWGNYTYSFTYDNMNRLTNANSANQTFNAVYAYDGNGHMTTRNFSGVNNSFNRETASHRIANIIENGASKSVSYDSRGSLTFDALSNWTTNEFNRSNLPLYMNSGNKSYRFGYNEKGERITKDFEDDTTETRSYYLKDHLGNIRCAINNDGTLLNAQDYYPYGETIRQFNNTRYMLTEKERDAESGNDYFGARYYNNKLGVWLQVDPLSEKYPGVSPYAYTLNNPMRFIDLYGMQSEEPEGWENSKLYQLPEIEVIAKKPQEPHELRMLYNLYLRSNDVEKSNFDATPYIGFGVDYLQHRVSNKMDEIIGRKKFKATKAKAAAKYNRYLKPLKIISTGLTFFDIGTSVYEGASTGDWSQTSIDLGIIGISAVSGPIGLGLTVMDQTIGIKNMWHAGVRMEIDRARKGLPSPMNYLP